MTYGDKWEAMSRQEKRIVRVLELKQEIETLRGNHKSAWKPVKMQTHNWTVPDSSRVYLTLPS